VTAFKTDENLPIEAAELLRAAGLAAATVLEQKLGGRADSDIAQVCQAERRALVTLDVDFANIDAYPPADHPGIVVMRLARQDKAHVLAVLGARRMARNAGALRSPSGEAESVPQGERIGVERL